MMNVGANVKNQMIGVLAEMIICGILVRVIESNKVCNIDEYQILKIVRAKSVYLIM